MALSGGGFNHTASGIMTSVITMGMLTDILMDARRLNQSRCEAACRTIRTKVPEMRLTVPQASSESSFVN